jgi:hypothetical protein
MNTPCPFLDATLQFKGTPSQQAQCLLRKVRVGREALEAIKAEVGSLLFSAMTAPRPHCGVRHG